MNCNRISSYIRQLLHLSIKNHCLLGRLITLNVNIITSNTSDHGVLTRIQLHDEIITHNVFYGKTISLQDPFKSHDKRILLSEAYICNAFYYSHIRDRIEVIRINHSEYNHHSIMTMISNTWYSGVTTMSGLIKRYDVFNCDDRIIKITHHNEYLLINYDHDVVAYRLIDNTLSQDKLIIEDIRQKIISCLHLLNINVQS